MAIERTFSIIKPDATARNLTGAVNAVIEKAGLRIVAQKRIRMTREQAETFYAVHKARPFFGELVEFMTSAGRGPGAGRRGRRRQIPRRHGRDQSGQGGRGHHPQGSRKIDRREFGARLGRAGNRCDRDRAVLLRQRDRRLIDNKRQAIAALNGASEGGTDRGLGVANI